ncbi:MAG: signal peptidase II [Alphaproteobacteria bacterium]
MARPAFFTGIGRLGFMLSAAIIAADQATKTLFLKLGLLEGMSLPLFGPFKLTMVWNQGISFSLLTAQSDLARWALTLFAVGVAVFLGSLLRRAERGLLTVGLGLVMGGALGNAIDRIRFGAVVDFFDATSLMFPWIFNLADSAISIGVVFLLLDSLLQKPEASVAD